MSLLLLLRTLVGAPIAPPAEPVYGDPKFTRGVSAPTLRVGGSPALDGATGIGGGMFAAGGRRIGSAP